MVVMKLLAVVVTIALASGGLEVLVVMNERVVVVLCVDVGACAARGVRIGRDKGADAGVTSASPSTCPTSNAGSSRRRGNSFILPF